MYWNHKCLLYLFSSLLYQSKWQRVNLNRWNFWEMIYSFICSVSCQLSVLQSRIIWTTHFQLNFNDLNYITRFRKFCFTILRLEQIFFLSWHTDWLCVQADVCECDDWYERMKKIKRKKKKQLAFDSIQYVRQGWHLKQHFKFGLLSFINYYITMLWNLDFSWMNIWKL